MKRVIILFVLCSMILAACTGGEKPVAAPTAEQASGGIQPAQEEAASQGSKPAQPAGPAMERLAVGLDVEILDVQMFDALQGWAIGTTGSDDHILRTFDNGQTWKDLTPPEPVGSGAVKKATSFFFSLNEGWVTYYPEGGAQPAAVWYTTDSGKTWTASESLDAKGLDTVKLMTERLFFVDAKTGWLALTGEQTADSQPGVIYRTTNGGARWERIFDASADANSIGRCCRTGMAFLDKNVGIVTMMDSTNPKPQAFWTSDGGKSWKQQDVPPADEKLFAVSACGTLSPSAFSAQGVVVVVDCIEFAGMLKTHHPFIYFTTDQGQTWKWMEAPLAQIADGKWETIDRVFRIKFLDAQVGWLFVEDVYTHKDAGKNKQLMQMFQTRDGGQTWKKVTTSQWFGKFSFLSADVGWAAIIAGSDAAMLKTADGGSKWDSFQPTIRE